MPKPVNRSAIVTQRRKGVSFRGISSLLQIDHKTIKRVIAEDAPELLKHLPKFTRMELNRKP